MTMEVKMNKTTTVYPQQQTPQHSIWLSNLDMISRNNHTQNAYFYRPKESASADFFCPDKLKDALSRVLVPFYPIAGRLKRSDKNGRPEIDCNAKGVFFVEADTNSSLDMDEFDPTLDMRKLVPKVDYSAGISSYPLLVLQLTRFKCGSVSLGVGIHHWVGDGNTGLHFINSWADLARGQDVRAAPFFDRSLLKARHPPQPKFDHIEYRISPSPTNPTLVCSIFKLTKEDIDTLKLRVNEVGDNNVVNYTSYEILTAYVWRCVTMARGLAPDQETKLQFPVTGRSRLHPPLPLSFSGNVVFTGAVITQAKDVVSNPTRYAAGRIHEFVKKMDNEYLRSAIDYLEMLPDVTTGARDSRTPNLIINAWTKLPIHDADFGWGSPIFMGPVIIKEGNVYMLPSPTNDGSLLVAISLENEQVMKLFEKYLYEFRAS